MKRKKMFLPFLAFTAALSSSQLFAEQTQIEQTADSKNENLNKSPTSAIEKMSQKLWTEFSQTLNNAKLKTNVNVPTSQIANGLSLGGSYAIDSRPSVGGKYSSIDVWDVNINASPEIFGISNPTEINIGASWQRQITFIQQFDDRYSSLVRMPYDPITKLPTKSDVFFKTTYNKETRQNENIIKDGTFIAFRAPLTFSVGKGISFSGGPHISLDAGLSWVLSGEFDIHIFRMKDNQVRVKILAIRDNVKSGYLGLNLMGFSHLGKLAISRVIDTNLVQINAANSKSELSISDYIFNLNHAESRDLYDQLIGHKIKSYDVGSIATQMKLANPFTKDNKTVQKMMADLDVLNSTAESDSTKAMADRRIIHVSHGKNDTESNSHGFKLNLFRVAKSETRQTLSVSKATIYAEDDRGKNNKFILETTSKLNSYEWFWLWGEKDVASTSLLLKATDDFKPEKVLGFQISRTKDDLLMSSKEYSEIQRIHATVLPPEITSHITWPEWDFSNKGSVANVHIEQDLLFTENLFKSKIQIDQETIRKELIQIIKNYGKFRSSPMNIGPQTGDATEDGRRAAYIKGDYVNAFSENWEQQIIPQYLTVVLNSNYSAEQRYAAYSYLNYNVPLFAEINGILLTRLIPTEALPQIVVARLALSARNEEASESFYPSKDAYNKMNLFREITYQAEYILNRSFDLRNFLKEDGSIYSAEEVLLQRTAK